MSSVEVGGEGRHVEEHNTLREGKRVNHRRHEGEQLDLIGGQKQPFKRRKDARTKEQIESEAVDMPDLAFHHGEHAHTPSSGLCPSELIPILVHKGRRGN
jgi:hypothetical protein